MDRKLNCFFQIDTVVADSVAGFELCEELGRPTALEIEVRFASAITSENALGLSAFFALKDAVAASAGHKAVVKMDAPATPERILLACERVRAQLSA